MNNIEIGTPVSLSGRMGIITAPVDFAQPDPNGWVTITFPNGDWSMVHVDDPDLCIARPSSVQALL